MQLRQTLYRATQYTHCDELVHWSMRVCVCVCVSTMQEAGGSQLLRSCCTAQLPTSRQC